MILVIIYMLGPKVKTQELTIAYPDIPMDAQGLEQYLQNREDTVKGLKPGNEAYILWADSITKKKTPYSIVYIHGFGASPMEGSSSKSSLGRPIKARAIASICCSPPESVPASCD